MRIFKVELVVSLITVVIWLCERSKCVNFGVILNKSSRSKLNSLNENSKVSIRGTLFSSSGDSVLMMLLWLRYRKFNNCVGK